MVGLVHINHVLGVDMVCAAPKALAERAEANFPRKASSAETVALPLKISKAAWLPRRRVQIPFLEAQIFRKLKTPQNFDRVNDMSPRRRGRRRVTESPEVGRAFARNFGKYFRS